MLIYCDDLGYGDPGCYNQNSKIPTPNIDKLASEGIRFTDAHTPAAICGPSRYGLLTGCYPWRRTGGNYNGNWNDQIKIEDGRITIASLLKDNGYNTAIFGKWGLRFDWRSALKTGYSGDIKLINSENFDYSKPILGPNIRGFDYSFCSIYFGSRDKPCQKNKPTSYLVEGKHWFFENGMICDSTHPNFDQFDYSVVQQRITKNTIDYLNAYVGKNKQNDFNIDKSKPFFIYYSTPAPHTPIAPDINFKGYSKAGEYGDFVAELDFRVGQILIKLKELDLEKNTIVIFSSDNGPEKSAYQRIQHYHHYSMGKWRGLKRDNWEGGTRVPFIFRWPEKIHSKIKSTPICLTDVMATLAEITGSDLPEKQGEDSYSILSLLLDDKYKYDRVPIIYHTYKQEMAIRDQEWILIDAPTGMASEEPGWFREERGVIKHTGQVELFNLETDSQQLENLASKYPEKVVELKSKLDEIIHKN